MIALRMSLRQTYILVHVEGDDILKRYLTGAVGFNESIVHANGRRTCGKSQHELVVGGGIELIDTLNDVACCPL
jgi:hypothetical protein